MPSPRASITPGWGQGTAENSWPPPGPSSSQVPATPAPAPRPRPAAALSPWPFCPRSAGVCCRCGREWRGSRSGMCFWTSCRRPSPQPRRSRPKYGHQLAKAIQGGWLVRRREAELLTSRSAATDSWTWTRDTKSVNLHSQVNQTTRTLKPQQLPAAPHSPP